MSDHGIGAFEFEIDEILALPEPQRTIALKQVAYVKQRVEANPIWKLRPHEGEKERCEKLGLVLTGEESRGQVEFHELNQRDVFMGAVVAGNRFGKSHSGIMDGLVQTLPSYFLPPWYEQYRRRPYNGDYRCRFVGPDEPNWLNKVIIPKLRKLIPPLALHGGTWQKAYNARDRMLRFADESWWDFLTHNMEVDAFAGADLDRVLFDEEPPGNKGYLQYDESLARLIDRQGDVRFTMTPLLGFTWLYYELTSDDVPRKDDEVYVVEGSMEDNPTLPTKEIERLRKRYEKRDPGRLQARMHGRFVHFAGLIYPEFRETDPSNGGHLVPPREIPRAENGTKPIVPYYVTIDPGVDHPAGIVAFWVNPDDTVEVFFAEKAAEWPLDDFAKTYWDLVAEQGAKPRWTVIDPVAKNRNWQTGRNLQDHMRREYGIHTIPGQNAVPAGIAETRGRLITNRIVIHSDLDQLRDEFRGYRWKSTERKQTEDEPKKEPVKKNDDLLDPLRYGLMSLPNAGKAPEEEDKRGFEEQWRSKLLHADLKRRMRSRRSKKAGGVGSRL